MDCVINRHGDLIRVPSVPTEIDDIHRRIRDKGTFDRDDLDAILEHYATVDPEGILRDANKIADLQRLLDTIGAFSDLVPQPNSDMLDDIEHHFQKQEGGHHDVDEWYAPHIIYGSTNNHESTVDAGEPDGYINLLRYDNGNSPTHPGTGYEIEFFYDHGYPTITLADQPA